MELRVNTYFELKWGKKFIFLLTLKAPITTAADDKFFNIFPNFRKKIRYEIS